MTIWQIAGLVGYSLFLSIIWYVLGWMRGEKEGFGSAKAEIDRYYRQIVQLHQKLDFRTAELDNLRKPTVVCGIGAQNQVAYTQDATLEAIGAKLPPRFYP